MKYACADEINTCRNRFPYFACSATTPIRDFESLNTSYQGRFSGIQKSALGNQKTASIFKPVFLVQIVNIQSEGRHQMTPRDSVSATFMRRARNASLTSRR